MHRGETMKKRNEPEKKTDNTEENEMVHNMDDVEELGKEMEQISQNEDYPIDSDEGLEKSRMNDHENVRRNNK